MILLQLPLNLFGNSILENTVYDMNKYKNESLNVNIDNENNGNSNNNNKAQTNVKYDNITHVLTECSYVIVPLFVKVIGNSGLHGKFSIKSDNYDIILNVKYFWDLILPSLPNNIYATIFKQNKINNYFYNIQDIHYHYFTNFTNQNQTVNGKKNYFLKTHRHIHKKHISLRKFAI